MEDGDLALIPPDACLADEFLAMLDELRAAAERTDPELRDRAQEDFAGLPHQWQDEAAGVNLAPGKVAQERYWLMRGGRRLLGTIHLRPRMEEELARKIGHIGSTVRPSERGRGYATLMLRWLLPKARERGLRFVWLTCRKTNVVSAHIIRRNGGVLEGEFIHPEENALFERYRIDLAGDRSLLGASRHLLYVGSEGK